VEKGKGQQRRGNWWKGQGGGDWIAKKSGLLVALLGGGEKPRRGGVGVNRNRKQARTHLKKGNKRGSGVGKTTGE